MKRDSKNVSEHKTNPMKIVAFIILLIISCLWLLPILWMFGTSIKNDTDLMINANKLFPSFKDMTFERYVGLLTNDKSHNYGTDGNFPIVFWIRNSLIISVVSVVLNLLVFCLAAYAFVFLQFKFKNAIWAIIIGSMTIPGVATFVAKYAMLMRLGQAFNYSQFYLYSIIILPGCAGVFNLFLVRQFFLSIPKDLIESAHIDGASNFKIFKNIILPLSKSVLIVTGLFCFSGAWNDYLWSQLILSGQNSEWSTLTVGLAGYAAGNSPEYIGRTMAAATISTIPVLIVYIICQRKIIDGIATTGVKR